MIFIGFINLYIRLRLRFLGFPSHHPPQRDPPIRSLPAVLPARPLASLPLKKTWPFPLLQRIGQPVLQILRFPGRPHSLSTGHSVPRGRTRAPAGHHCAVFEFSAVLFEDEAVEQSGAGVHESDWKGGG